MQKWLKRSGCIWNNAARTGPQWKNRRTPQPPSQVLTPAETELEVATNPLLAAFADCPAEILVVSYETGMGIVPENALARRFREAQGRLNITLAARADRVVQVVAGLPNVLKGSL